MKIRPFNSTKVFKGYLRDELKKLRNALSQKRQEEARCALFSHLLPILNSFDHVLSFASFGSEIDTSLLNYYLAHTQRLLLSKTIDDTLKIFKVTNPQTQLLQNSFGLYEPNPKVCQEVENSTIQVILVPALGFDQHNHRLGYGKGCYDKFLQQVPHAHTIGIGFKEQLISSLPRDNTDVALEKVSLF